jgi:hypothetical protein
VEICNGDDDDCDGAVDDGFTCPFGGEGACMTSCGTVGTGPCTDSCSAAPVEECDPPVENCADLADNDCDDLLDCTDDDCIGDLACGF